MPDSIISPFVVYICVSSDEVLAWWSVWSKVQMICICQLMPLPPHLLLLH